MDGEMREEENRDGRTCSCLGSVKASLFVLKEKHSIVVQRGTGVNFRPLWKSVFPRLDREAEISSSAAMATGRRDNCGLPWSS